MAAPTLVRVSHSAWFAISLVSATVYAGDCCVGTYSTLSYNRESGDLHGLEITIVPTDSGLAASVQIADDGINELHLASIQRSGDNLTFSTNLDDGSDIQFSMACTTDSCNGTYQWGHAKVKFLLPKSPGYWNRKAAD